MGKKSILTFTVTYMLVSVLILEPVEAGFFGKIKNLFGGKKKNNDGNSGYSSMIQDSSNSGNNINDDLLNNIKNTLVGPESEPQSSQIVQPTKSSGFFSKLKNKLFGKKGSSSSSQPSSSESKPNDEKSSGSGFFSKLKNKLFGKKSSESSQSSSNPSSQIQSSSQNQPNNQNKPSTNCDGMTDSIQGCEQKAPTACNNNNAGYQPWVHQVCAKSCCQVNQAPAQSQAASSENDDTEGLLGQLVQDLL